MKRSKLIMLLLSFLVAFSMWLYVITIVSPESEQVFYNVPVVFEGKDSLTAKGLMLVSDEEPTVTLKLTGNRSDLIKLNSSNIKVTADLTRIFEPGEFDLNYTVSYPSGIVTGAVGVRERKPNYITATLDRLVKDKPIEVRVETNGTAIPAGYKLMETNLSVEQVLITGPASVVDKIEYARVDVDLTGRKKSFADELAVTLCDADGNGVESKLVEADLEKKTVNAEFIIYQIKELSLGLKLNPGGGATESTVRVEFSPLDSAVVYGNESLLKEYDSLILGTVNLAEIRDGETREFELVLPAGMELEGEPQTITATFTFPDLAVRELKISEFELVNVGDTLKGTVRGKQEITVTVRGPRDLVNTVKPEDLVLAVDCKDLLKGLHNASATVKVKNADFKGVGGLGTYTVSVDLTDKK